MSVWADIEGKVAEFEAELVRTRALVRVLKGGAVRVIGPIWRCSYRETRGARRTVHVRATSAAELVEALKALRPKKDG